MSSATPPISFPEPVAGKRLIVCAILLVCASYMAGMLWRHYDQPTTPDHALNAVIGHELLHGRRLYADLWDQKPPGVYAAYAAADLLVGYGPQELFLLN